MAKLIGVTCDKATSDPKHDRLLGDGLFLRVRPGETSPLGCGMGIVADSNAWCELMGCYHDTRSARLVGVCVTVRRPADLRALGE